MTKDDVIHQEDDGNLTVLHPHFVEAKDRLFRLALGGAPKQGELILILGPTRSGKTYLKDRLITELMRVNPACTDELAQEIPFIEEEAEAPHKGSFDYDELHKRLLNQLIPFSNVPRVKDIRPALIDALNKRATRWVMIDEAHHLLYTTSRSDDLSRRVNQMEAIKGLINQTGIQLLFFGNQAIEAAVRLSPQLRSRTKTIRLGGYLMDISKEREVFANFCRSILSAHGFQDHGGEFNPQWIGEMMARCTGSIGAFAEAVDQCRRSGGELRLSDIADYLPDCEGADEAFREEYDFRKRSEAANSYKKLAQNAMKSKDDSTHARSSGSKNRAPSRGSARDAAHDASTD
ncbi:MAG: TniB family NTP-binding protein [Algiphilus sp.]|uniref:TniB family NTP-binding protein n=1 Tax=Algiphilus sp. TaxID=1872431 RepID=UPI0032EF533A